MVKSKSDRRTFLKAVGASAMTPLIAQNVEASVERHSIHFDKVVNIVEDYGADNTGTEPIDSELESAIDNNTLIKFPDGDYLLSDKFTASVTGNIGFVATDTGSPSLIPPDGFNDRLLKIYNTNKALIESIDIDISAKETTAGVFINVKKRAHVQDVEYIGRGTHPDSSVTNAFAFWIEDRDGIGILKNVKCKKGSAIGHYKGGDGRVGVYAGYTGTIRVKDCHFEEFGNNALYLSKVDGPVKIEGGVYRNNNVSQVRIGGEKSYVKDAKIEVDLDKYDGPKIEDGDSHNTRGVWLENSNNRSPGATISNCNIIVSKVERSTGAINVWGSSGEREVYIQNTEITIDSNNVEAVECEGSQAHIDNLTVKGSGSDAEIVDLETDYASGSTIKNSCFYQSGTSKNGIVADGAQNVEVSDTNINVTENAIVEINGGSVTTSNVTYDGDCSSSENPTITTDSPTEVTENSATLNGSITDMGSYDVISTYFKWGIEGESLSNKTSTQEISKENSFSQSITSLSKGTTYEYRAVGETDDGSIVEGGVVSFTTESAEKAPSIQNYTVSEANSPNPHTEITADWKVTDQNSNLDKVEILVEKDSSIVDSATNYESGGEASGTNHFKLKHTDGESFIVRIIVTDTKENKAEEKQTVSE